MRKQKSNQQQELLIVRVTEQEKKLLARIEREQKIKVEKFIHELIFSSGLINHCR